MDNLTNILIHLLSLEVDAPSYYHGSDTKNIIFDTKLSISDISGFLLYRDETPDMSGCVILHPDYINSGFIEGINEIIKNNLHCDTSFTWWADINDNAKGDPNSKLFHYTSLSDFLLAWISYEVFGHPFSRAGISNDSELLQQLDSVNVGKNFFNSILNLSKETLGSLYYQMKGPNEDRFINNTVYNIPNRFIVGKKINTLIEITTVNLANTFANIDDLIQNIQENLPIGIQCAKQGMKVSFFGDCEFAITFLHCGMTGELLGFSNQGSYTYDMSSSLIGQTDVNLQANIGFSYLPIIPEDIFRFEIQLSNYSIQNNGIEIMSNESSIFTLSIVVE